MLEFIVLGQIPGSNLRLTFGGVVMIWLCFLSILLATRGIRHKSRISVEIMILRIYISLRLDRKSILGHR